METTLNLRLSPGTKRRIMRLAKARGRTVSDVARDLLERALAVEEFRSLRARTLPQASAAGFVTDDDVFRAIS